MVIIWSLFIGSHNILLLLHHNVWKWPKWKSLIRWYLSSFQNTVPRLLRVSLQEGTKTRGRKAVCLIELWDFRNPLLASLPASVSSSSFHFWLDSLDKHKRRRENGREISISCCLFGKIYSLSPIINQVDNFGCRLQMFSKGRMPALLSSPFASKFLAEDWNLNLLHFFRFFLEGLGRKEAYPIPSGISVDWWTECIVGGCAGYSRSSSMYYVPFPFTYWRNCNRL